MTEPTVVRKARRRTAARRREPLSLAWRLGASLGLVVLAGAATLLVIALLVAPEVFRGHLAPSVAGPIDAALRSHVEGAFAESVLVALGVAVPVALCTAFVVSWVIARRFTRAVRAVASAAEHVAGGDFQTRVEAPGIGAELAQLAAAFNTMAARLAETETTRRRLIGDLAHELRTPLSALEATVDAVTEGILPPDATTMTTLHDQTARLSRLVADMAAVSRAEERDLALHTRPVDAGELAAQAVAAHAAAFTAAGRRLVLDRPAGALPVDVDPQRIGEALGNLLDNDLRHTQPGGTVAVAVHESGPWVLIQTVDTGTGFDPADAERIFERFYRGDPARTGTGANTGVGLTIARAIVAAHSGTLTASSGGPGSGATFTMALPRRAG